MCYSDKETIRILEDGWYYIQAGKKVDIKLPEIVKCEEESLVLFNECLTELDAGMTVTMKSAQYNAIIAYNDKILYLNIISI